MLQTLLTYKTGIMRKAVNEHSEELRQYNVNVAKMERFKYSYEFDNEIQ